MKFVDAGLSNSERSILLGSTRRGRARRILSLTAGLAILLAACGGGETAAPEPEASPSTSAPEAPADEPDPRGTTLTYSYPQEPPNWNYWETGLSAVAGPMFLNVWETLVKLEADGSPSPLLAESWDVSPDGTAVTFNIREGVTFHDGSDLTAADVVYSLQMNSQSGLSNVAGAFGSVESIEATGDYTVEVTLSAPSQRFLTRMGWRSGIIVPENFFEDNDAAEVVIGTGPYRLAEYRRDEDVTLARFDDYWGELPYFETVVQRFIPDETAAINALLAGELDMVASVIGEGIDRVESIGGQDGFSLELIPGSEVSYFALNTNVAAFQDIRVRQAIQYAHNRQSHVDAATAGTALVTCSMAVPAGVAWDTDDCAFPYDPERARELLEEAGATNLVLDFPYANVAWHTIMAQLFQAEMAEVGITIELRSQDLATWLDQTNTQSQYEVFQITSGATLDMYRCGANRQPFGKPDATAFCDEEMDAKIDALDSILDYDTYVAAQRELHDYVEEQGWIFATKKPQTPVLLRDDLTGLKPHRLPEPHIDVTQMRWAD